jgi:hypothetical protein
MQQLSVVQSYHIAGEIVTEMCARVNLVKFSDGAANAVSLSVRYKTPRAFALL